MFWNIIQGFLKMNYVCALFFSTWWFVVLKWLMIIWKFLAKIPFCWSLHFKVIVNLAFIIFYFSLLSSYILVVVKLDIVIFYLHSTLSLLFSICNYFGFKSRFVLFAKLICIYHNRILVNLICVFLFGCQENARKCKKSYDLIAVTKLIMSWK